MRLKSHVNYTSGLMTNRSGDVRLNERKKGRRPGKERQGNVADTDKQNEK